MGRKQIRLTAYGRTELVRFCAIRTHKTRLVTRAKIILSLDTSEGRIPERQGIIAKHLGISLQTIYNTKRDFLAAKNLSLFLKRKQRKSPPIPAKVTSDLETRIIELFKKYVYETNPSLPSRKAAELFIREGLFDSISHMTIYRLINKNFPYYYKK